MDHHSENLIVMVTLRQYRTEGLAFIRTTTLISLSPPPSIFFALEILRVISGSVSDQLWIFVYIEFHILIPPTYICLNSRLVTAIQFTADLVLLC